MCGVCRAEDAIAAAAAGADAVGMILHAKSKRLIEAQYAMAVADAIPPLVSRVGVFVDARAPFVAQCARSLKLDLIQLHGHETPDFVRSLAAFRVVRAVRVAEYDAWARESIPNLVGLLIDGGPGGTGEANDWDAVEAAIKKIPPRVPLFLAGGLTPETVGAVAARFRPWAVDVSSGIEAQPMIKSAEKMLAFARAVRDADGS